jgi:3-deoxy-manno-octulosonate cytidylyltransferase (CMP-KDO synthetase)
MLEQVLPGVTLIEHVYNQCVEQHHKDHVWVATDSKEVANLFGNQAIMTSPNCRNGTERIAEAAKELTWYDTFINVHGDMVDVPYDIIPLLESNIQAELDDVLTVCTEMNEEDRRNPSVVKCINNGEKAHWFCRAPLEYGDWHLGLYAYTRGALYDYVESFHIGPEEQIESLEQLRWLHNFYNIGIVWTEEHAAEINTPEDLNKWQHKTRQN